jgi:RNA polymerase sigma factor (sigma-70 family)
MTADRRTIHQLRGVASKLTGDAELQKDLLQEMFVHLFRIQNSQPAKTPSWYVKSCEFHARNYLRRGRSIDSFKRARNAIPLDAPRIDPIDPLDLRSEIIANDIIDLILPHLTDTQQRVFFLLLQGLGVREVARALGVSHPAIVKQRRKIALLASTLLKESGDMRRLATRNRISAFRGARWPSGMYGVWATRASNHLAERRPCAPASEQIVNESKRVNYKEVQL